MRATSSSGISGIGLRSHIRIWMLLIGFLPILVLFVFGYLAVRAALIEASHDHLISVVETRRAQIESWLKERVTDLEVISGSKDCIELVEQAAVEDHAAVCRYLASFQTGARDYKSLTLFDLNWEWVASHSGTRTQYEASLGEGLRGLVLESRGPVVLLRAEKGMSPGLLLAHELKVPGGAQVGYVLASLDLSRTFTPILADRAGLGRGGRVVLVDEAGRDLLALEDPGSVPAVRSELRAVSGTTEAGTLHYRDPVGEKVFAGYATIPEQGWILVAEIAEWEALSLLHSLERGFLVAALVTIVAVVALSARMAGRLSAPLGELAQAARRITGGRHHERVPTGGGREVAEVGLAFNEMLDSLEETRRLQVQASTLAAVGELSSGVVHEIRNRLSSVKMNLQALRKRVQGEKTYAELAGIAMDQVHRMEELMSELLRYARPVELDLAEVKVEDLLQEMSDLFRAEADARGVRLEVRDRSGNGSLLADRRRLGEALSNLIRNALEATGGGGQVVVSAYPGSDADEFWAMVVEDDGPGIDGIPGEDLFRPFFTSKEAGTGLGLAHVRKIVELHGGRVKAGPGSLGGAAFRLELPSRGPRRRDL